MPQGNPLPNRSNFYSYERSGFLSMADIMEQVAIDLLAFGVEVVKAKKWTDATSGFMHYQAVFQMYDIEKELNAEGVEVDVQKNFTYVIFKAKAKPHLGILDGGGGDIRVWSTTPDQVQIKDTFDPATDPETDFIKIARDPGFKHWDGLFALNSGVNTIKHPELLASGNTVVAKFTVGDGLSGCMQSYGTPWADWNFGDSAESALADPRTMPCSYRITKTAHGIFLYIWREGSDYLGGKYSWMLIQKAVDKQGRVMDIGKNPVFAVFSSKNEIFKFVVRETETSTPSPLRYATKNTEDSVKIINSENIVATTEAGKYCVFFPSNVNTQRYTYTAQLDMIAFTSADVISQGLNVDLEVFGGRKKYRSLQANRPYNTGMRLLCLTGQQYKTGVDENGAPIWSDTAPGPKTQKEDGESFFNPELELFPEPEVDKDIFSTSNPLG